MHSLRNSHGRSSSLHPGHEATGTAVLMGLQAGGAFGMSGELSVLRHLAVETRTEGFPLMPFPLFISLPLPPSAAACCRTGLMLAQQHLLAAPCGLGASVGLTSLGFAIQTKGLKDGKTVVVCTCAAVSSMVTGTGFPLETQSVCLPSLRMLALLGPPAPQGVSLLPVSCCTSLRQLCTPLRCGGALMERVRVAQACWWGS